MTPAGTDHPGITPDDFIFSVLPEALADATTPADASQDRVQIRFEGADGREAHLGLDADSDLTIEYGVHDAPLFEIVVEETGRSSLLGGALDADSRQVPGWGRAVRRLAAAFLLSRRAAAALSRIRGVAEIVLGGDPPDRATLRLVFRGQGPERRCRARLDAGTAVGIASGRIAARERFLTGSGSTEVEGDSGLLVDAVEALFPPVSRLADYLFVWDRAERAFPLRFEIGDPVSPPGDSSEVQGAIGRAHAEGAMAALRSAFTEPRYVVEQMSATSWQTVVDNFPGLYEHD